ncbi:hypothetical protein E4U33_006652 [Claviceps sp. LM78 group G4]|nr:hypothetical protein E4U33_006652 [Claviceps sp. LM78 group G4]
MSPRLARSLYILQLRIFGQKRRLDPQTSASIAATSKTANQIKSLMPVGTRSSVLRSEEPRKDSSHMKTDQDEEDHEQDEQQDQDQDLDQDRDQDQHQDQDQEEEEEEEEDMANDITQTLAQMQQTLTILMSKITTLENGRAGSEETRNSREQSAFSDQGKTFVPKGIAAAKAVFRKYPGEDMKNPNYSDNASSSPVNKLGSLARALALSL